MVVFDPGSSLQFFVAAALLGLVPILLAGSRGRTPVTPLIWFLIFVGINFAVGGWRFIVGWDAPAWNLAANVTLAWDPFFLFAFVTAYPWRRQGPWALAHLILLGTTAAVLSVAAAVPTSTVTAHFGADPTTGTPWQQYVLIANLGIGYLASWLVVCHGACTAPSRGLQDRNRWMMLALGIALLPRLLFIPLDLGLDDSLAMLWFGTQPEVDRSVFALVSSAAILAGVPLAAGAYAWGVRISRRSFLHDPTLRLVGGFLAAYALLAFLFAAMRSLGGTNYGFALAYALRWPLFAVILTYGIVAHELLDFPRHSRTGLAVYGGTMGAIGAFLLTSNILQATTDPTTDPALLYSVAVAVGLGASVPSAAAARSLRRTFDRLGPATPAAGRHLALYRAAVESVHASGATDRRIRARLAKDRRNFGVSVEQADAIERMVAEDMQTPASPAAGDEPLPGIVLLRPLGQGGQASVWAAKDTRDDATVVVKFLHHRSEKDAHRAAARRRWFREHRALRRLDHPDVVKVRMLDIRGDTCLLVLDHVAGRSLRDRLDAEGLTVAEAHTLAYAITDAVAALHQAGVCHGDLNPSNIVLRPDGTPCIIDLGLSQIHDGAPEIDQTATGLAPRAPMGTLGYLAPESVATGIRDKTTDVFALGAVIYECLTGRRAIDVRGLDAAARLRALADPVIDHTRLPASTPWEHVLPHMLARSPADRPADAQAVLARLERPLSLPRAE